MTDIDKQIDKAGEIENRFTDIRGEIKAILEATITLSETLGVAVKELYDLMAGLEELKEMDDDYGQSKRSDDG